MQPSTTQSSRRDEFDPRCREHQKKRSLGDYNLDALAEVSGGKAAALLYAGMYRDEEAINAVPDISFPVQEEDVSTSHMLDVSTVCDRMKNGKKFVISNEERDWIVAATVDQSESEQWFHQREARITASNIGNVLKHVDESHQVIGATHSITATIMGYYKMDGDKLPKPLQWGRSQESKALSMYLQRQRQHKGLKLQKTGLWVSTEHPFLAASPDGLINCQCCGVGVVEVKCPWACRSNTISEFASQKDSCLQLSGEVFSLKQSHQYYSQVQLQMFCTGRSYCDFVVYTTAAKDNLCIVRIPYNELFVQQIPKASVFWHQVIVPEIHNKSVARKLEESRNAKV